MREPRWTNEALLGLTKLTRRERETLFTNLDLVGQFPAMYPARQRGRFAGLRYFVVARRWVVYYRPGEHTLLILAIVPALPRPS